MNRHEKHRTTKKPSSRRDFLRTVATTTACSLPYYVPARALGFSRGVGANERIRVGVIGAGIRGKYLTANLPAEGQVTAVCDCHRQRVADTLAPKGRFRGLLANFGDSDARFCKPHQDYRRMLDDEQLDAVMIATPDHHHVLAAILACQAGLDVYVEKALSLTIAEGRALVSAVKRHGRVCQVGSQNRSLPVNIFGCRLIREGGIGKVTLIELPNYPGPMRFESLPKEPAPPGMDWNLFCGPTPLRRYNRKLWEKDVFMVDGISWRGWDLWRSYSGHYMTNWGAHSLDMIQHALGTDRSGPVEVWPLLEGYQGEMRLCPVAARYKSGVELRFVFEREARRPWTFHGENGKAFMTRNRLQTQPADLAAGAPAPLRVAPGWQGNSSDVVPHIQNWLGCIKSRATPRAPVEVGHRSVTICHLANIARELRRKLRWDPITETFPDDQEANTLLDRPRRDGFRLPDSA